MSLRPSHHSSFLKVGIEKDGISIGVTLPFEGQLSQDEIMNHSLEIYDTLESTKKEIELKRIEMYLKEAQNGAGDARDEGDGASGDDSTRDDGGGEEIPRSGPQDRGNDRESQGNDESEEPVQGHEEEANESSLGVGSHGEESSGESTPDNRGGEGVSGEDGGGGGDRPETGQEDAGRAEEANPSPERSEDNRDEDAMVSLDEHIKEGLSHLAMGQYILDNGQEAYDELGSEDWEEYATKFAHDLIGDQDYNTLTYKQKTFIINIIKNHHLN